VAVVGVRVLTDSYAATIPGVKVRIVNLSPTLQMVLGTVDTTAEVKIRPVQSNNNLYTLSTVSQMCSGCLMAVNGDFFDLTTPYEPLGGVIKNGIVLRSPDPRRQEQASITSTGQIAIGALNFTGTLTTSDQSSLPFTVNVDHDSNNPIVLYDNHFGNTPTTSSDYELLLSGDPSGLALAKPLSLNILGRHTPGTPVAAGQVVLSGAGSSATQIQQLWQKYKANTITGEVQVLMTTNPPVSQSLGGSTVLVNAGQAQTITGDCFATCALPRTVMGSDATGRFYFMTIGSNTQGVSNGVSLTQAGSIALSYGMTEAINLDGGGSTTFVSNGSVINHPSDGTERSVSNAWVVTPKP